MIFHPPSAPPGDQSPLLFGPLGFLQGRGEGRHHAGDGRGLCQGVRHWASRRMLMWKNDLFCYVFLGVGYEWVIVRLWFPSEPFFFTIVDFDTFWLNDVLRSFENFPGSTSGRKRVLYDSTVTEGWWRRAWGVLYLGIERISISIDTLYIKVTIYIYHHVYIYIYIYVYYTYIYIYKVYTYIIYTYIHNIHNIHIYIYNIYIIYLGKLWRPHCDLTGIMVNKGNHPQMALVQVCELL